VQPLIAPAILDHEAIVGLERGLARNRSTSVSGAGDAERQAQKHLDQLQNHLTHFHRNMFLFGVDHEVIVQIFKQVGYLCRPGWKSGHWLKSGLLNKFLSIYLSLAIFIAQKSQEQGLATK